MQKMTGKQPDKTETHEICGSSWGNIRDCQRLQFYQINTIVQINMLSTISFPPLCNWYKGRIWLGPRSVYTHLAAENVSYLHNTRWQDFLIWYQRKLQKLIITFRKPYFTCLCTWMCPRWTRLLKKHQWRHPHFFTRKEGYLFCWVSTPAQLRISHIIRNPLVKISL